MNAPHKYIFFTDRNLGKQFPLILKENGIHVERHNEHFADDTRDEEWLSEIGRRGWFAITHDRRIRYKINEIEVVRIHRVGLFIVIGKAPLSELAENFVNTFSKIEKFIDQNSPPFIAKIYRPEHKVKKTARKKPGAVKMWVSFR